MIPLQEVFYQLAALLQVISLILIPAQTLFPQGTIKALNVGLLILSVGSGNTMLGTKKVNISGVSMPITIC